MRGLRGDESGIAGYHRSQYIAASKPEQVMFLLGLLKCAGHVLNVK